MGIDCLVAPTYINGIAERHRDAAVELYEEAFGGKFSVAVGSKEQRARLFQRCLDLDYAIGAVRDSELLGLAGYCTAEGALTGSISYAELISQLGFIKGNWAAFVFTLYDRTAEPGELLMDGIVVRSVARGLGIGSGLLDEICSLARRNGCQSVRLDVIDTNPRARKLYESLGFEAVKTEKFLYLKWLLGFGGATTMVLDLKKVDHGLDK